MFNQLKSEELMLLHHALCSVYVADQEKTRLKLLAELKKSLGRQGITPKQES